jgi:hypothetical protein
LWVGCDPYLHASSVGMRAGARGVVAAETVLYVCGIAETAGKNEVGLSEVS